jgi:flagellar motor protein MotB
MRVFSYVLILVSSVGIGTFYGTRENGRQTEQQAELKAAKGAKQQAEREAKQQAEKEAELKAEQQTEEIRQAEQQADKNRQAKKSQQVEQQAMQQKAMQLANQRAVELLNAKVEVTVLISKVYEAIMRRPTERNLSAFNLCVEDWNRKKNTTTLYDCKEMLRWGNEFIELIRQAEDAHYAELDAANRQLRALMRQVCDTGERAPLTRTTIRILDEVVVWMRECNRVSLVTTVGEVNELIHQGNEFISSTAPPLILR